MHPTLIRSVVQCLSSAPRSATHLPRSLNQENNKLFRERGMDGNRFNDARLIASGVHLLLLPLKITLAIPWSGDRRCCGLGIGFSFYTERSGIGGKVSVEPIVLSRGWTWVLRKVKVASTHTPVGYNRSPYSPAQYRFLL
jgi:hypothetical protein